MKEIKSKLAAALERYRAIANTAPAAEVREASAAVKALQAELSAAICEGANPCPDCGGAPHGIEQPRIGGGVEYEVGCTRCGWFLHTDDTPRDHGARGGLLPRHAVEAWNEGPDYWKSKSLDKFDAAEHAKLSRRQQAE